MPQGRTAIDALITADGHRRGAEQNVTALGGECFSTDPFPRRHTVFDEGVTRLKTPYTMSDLLTMFSAAGFSAAGGSLP